MLIENSQEEHLQQTWKNSWLTVVEVLQEADLAFLSMLAASQAQSSVGTSCLVLDQRYSLRESSEKENKGNRNVKSCVIIKLYRIVPYVLLFICNAAKPPYSWKLHP